jgi:hypothetical protein
MRTLSTITALASRNQIVIVILSAFVSRDYMIQGQHLPWFKPFPTIYAGKVIPQVDGLPLPRAYPLASHD